MSKLAIDFYHTQEGVRWRVISLSATITTIKDGFLTEDEAMKYLVFLEEERGQA